MSLDCTDSMREQWQILKQPSAIIEWDGLRDICGFWENLVIIYSRGQLTYSKDKLAALSGVASELQAITGDHYLAGMWKGDLLRQLL